MRLGVSVPNFGPGTDPDLLCRWAQVAEGLGFDVLMVSDHVVLTPEVAGRYPPPFFEPFTTLAWLAARTSRIRLGTSVLIVPYRHPLLVARMAANLQQLSGGRLVLGVGAGWARQEFDALGVPFERRGRVTDEHLRAMRAAWEDDDDNYRGGCAIPFWVGGGSGAAPRGAAGPGVASAALHAVLAARTAAAAGGDGGRGRMPAARAEAADPAARHRHAGRGAGPARRRGHDRAGRRRPRRTTRARRADGDPRPLPPRPARDAAARARLADAGRGGRAPCLGGVIRGLILLRPPVGLCRKELWVGRLRRTG
ncbi:LLM class flavin-dependent oxidoreductase [Nonomuraea sp. NN258]|uniref:LLM class flavin-dependent oxidoreductase n=1 Tax=Nonomuraea antri TaxID=2730852 RepID=UPI0015683CAF|nr:LLM class flavin-dependent oxidoreductase [Nonomuraea antri]